MKEGGIDSSCVVTLLLLGSIALTAGKLSNQDLFRCAEKQYDERVAVRK